MKKRVFWIVLICLLVTSLVLVSCSKSNTTSTSTSTPTSSSTTTSTPTSSSTPTSTTTVATTTSTTTAATGNWWDSLGKPQYGGEMDLRLNRDLVAFDPYFASAAASIMSAWMEPLHMDDWTLDASVFSYRISYRPYQYVKGCLAESWDLPDPSTYVVHLRQGVHWQDIPPVNGREFTADDVVFHYDRLYGKGGGFTNPSPFVTNVTDFQDLISVTATDKYTVVFKWKTPNPENIIDAMQALNTTQYMEPREAVGQWGDVNDWHHAIGTGPFILKDYVSANSATLVKNPNYWGYDERYPQNKLPYIDTLKVLLIPDDATALAALRTGKIDALDGISLQNSQSIQKTNPKILQTTMPAYGGTTVDLRNDKVPFNDIRVREAMQMAIDLPTIATTYFGGTCPPYPISLTTQYMTGWGFPYSQWPQDLKDEYAYNPTAAKKLLADAGYPNGFKTNVVADVAANLDLLQIVKSYLAQIGIDMEIRTMDSASANAFILVGKKQDQMAYRPVGTLGISGGPIRQLTYYRTGATQNFDMISDPVFDAFYTKAMAATNTDDIKKILRDANEYVARQHFAIAMLQPNVFALYQPWLKGYNGQLGSIGGSASGPQNLFFYPARFWIDQNLKKSLGH